MTTEDKMSLDERRKYLRTVQRRYKQGDRKTKRQLLDEMEAVTGMHRESLIRSMNGSLRHKPRRREEGGAWSGLGRRAAHD